MVLDIPTDDLTAAGIDVAAIFTEEFLNNFASTHHSENEAVYRGSSQITELDDLVEIRFEFSNPITFDLFPISKRRFLPIWHNHLLARGADPTQISDYVSAPENLVLSSQSVQFKVIVFNGQDTSSIKLEVDFLWNLMARVMIRIEEGALKLEPLKVTFAPSADMQLVEIRERVAIAAGRALTDGGSNYFNTMDDEWCLKVEQLIILLLNQILNTQISNFIRTWELPRGIELIDDIELQADYLQIANDLLIVGAQIVPSALTQSSQVAEKFKAVMVEYRERTSSESVSFAKAEPEKVTAADIEVSETADWFESRGDDVQRSMVELENQYNSLDDVHAYPENLLVLANDKLFDLIAARELAVNESWGDEKKLDRLLKGKIGWWAKVGNGRANIVAGGINVEAEARIGGEVRVCHFDIDPKNFGRWRCHGPCVNLTIEPKFSLQAFPYFSNRGMFFRTRLTSRSISLSHCDWPPWANKLLGWVTRMLTRPFMSALRQLSGLFKIKVVDFPEHFPGTALTWEARINARPRNEGEYLVISGDPKFS